MKKHSRFQEEWLSRKELERLGHMREFHQYLGTTMEPERPANEVLQGTEMRLIEVVISRDGPGD